MKSTQDERKIMRVPEHLFVMMYMFKKTFIV